MDSGCHGPKPVVEMYGIEHLLATEPEFKSGRFTGKVSGIPCFQSGKIDNLMPWLEKNNESLIYSTLRTFARISFILEVFQECRTRKYGYVFLLL